MAQTRNRMTQNVIICRRSWKQTDSMVVVSNMNVCFVWALFYCVFTTKQKQKDHVFSGISCLIAGCKMGGRGSQNGGSLSYKNLHAALFRIIKSFMRQANFLVFSYEHGLFRSHGIRKWNPVVPLQQTNMMPFSDKTLGFWNKLAPSMKFFLKS